VQLPPLLRGVGGIRQGLTTAQEICVHSSLIKGANGKYLTALDMVRIHAYDPLHKGDLGGISPGILLPLFYSFCIPRCFFKTRIDRNLFSDQYDKTDLLKQCLWIGYLPLSYTTFGI
jgi:hypothetical protein